jgi:hypothetical protein
MDSNPVRVNNRSAMGRVRMSAIIILLGIMWGCADPSQVSSLEKRVADLEKKVVTSSSDVEKLKNSVKQLEQGKSYDDLIRNFDSIAYLTPGSGGYSVIRTDLGRITVMVEKRTAVCERLPGDASIRQLDQRDDQRREGDRRVG